VVVYDSPAAPQPRIVPLALKERFRGDKIAVFSSGRFFIAGVRQPATGVQEPYFAVFSPDGSLISEVHFGSTPRSVNSTPRRQKYFGMMTELDAARVALTSVASSGAAVYVLDRAGAPDLIAIDDSGTIVRSLRLHAPLAGAQPNNLRVYDDRTALIQFTLDGTAAVYTVLDLASGDTIKEYSAANVAAAGSLACYQLSDLTFFSGSSLAHVPIF
jgi:hypothetical protein